MFRSLKCLFLIALVLLVLGVWSTVQADVINVESGPGYQSALIDRLTAIVNILRQVIVLEQQKLALIKAAAEDVPLDAASSLAPVITSVSPGHGPSGTVITLRGRNFSPTDNTIFTGFAKIEHVSSNGESLSFTLRSPWNLDHTSWVKGPNFPEIKLRFYVRDDEGRQTKIPGEFVLDM